MDPNDGRIYEGVEEIENALKRGEPIIELSPEEAEEFKKLSEDERMEKAKAIVKERGFLRYYESALKNTNTIERC